ncbi:MAG: methyltransferase domain-containing protein [Gaiellaceae bacterium]
MSKADQYDRAAEGWSDEAYADPAGYLARRAVLVVGLGPRLEPGDRVLDLACGDGGLAEFLVPYEVEYLGLDLSGPMVEAARRRGRTVELGDLNDYEPAGPVAATTCFRAIYYARDRAAFFRRVAGYTDRKLVFDLNPRQYPVADVERDLRAAGFGRLELRPFFSPQTVAVPRPVAAALRAAERSGPLARLALRFRFTYVCAAWR